MATWRRRALDVFPDLRHDLNSPDYTIYSLLFDVLPALRDAHRAGDDTQLSRIYGFAAWCSGQRSKLLWNAVGVSFYEHLFDEPWMREAVCPWLSADIRAKHMELWEARLAPKDFDQVNKLLRRNPPRPR
jgi:hypothetical protein